LRTSLVTLLADNVTRLVQDRERRDTGAAENELADRPRQRASKWLAHPAGTKVKKMMSPGF
jgi:hypothetical protein